MSILESVKETVGLIQKIDNIDLYRQVLDLQSQILQLVEDNLSLKNENRDLRNQLTTRGNLSFRANGYWLGDEGPYCTGCWDGESKLVRIHVENKTTPQCPRCKVYTPSGAPFPL
jgi:hypothetical protein